MPTYKQVALYVGDLISFSPDTPVPLPLP